MEKLIVKKTHMEFVEEGYVIDECSGQAILETKEVVQWYEVVNGEWKPIVEPDLNLYTCILNEIGDSPSIEVFEALDDDTHLQVRAECAYCIDQEDCEHIVHKCERCQKPTLGCNGRHNDIGNQFVCDECGESDFRRCPKCGFGADISYWVDLVAEDLVACPRCASHVSVGKTKAD